MDWEEYKKHCYMFARNQNDYLKDESFSQRLGDLIDLGSTFGSEISVSYIESMIAHGDEYLKAEQQYAPILIYKSESLCYDMLNHFADLMAEALDKLGEIVEIIDVRELPLDYLLTLSGKKYKAILGFQTYLYSVNLVDGRKLHDNIIGPKYNMQFDHPACMKNHFSSVPRNMNILIHDRNYKQFIEKEYPDINKTYIMPPAGEEYLLPVEKIYKLSFVGTYNSPDKWDNEIESMDKNCAGNASKLRSYMLENPNETYEACLKKFVENPGLEDYFNLKCVYFSVMSYYRKKIILEILEAGITLDVFGDSWKDEIFSKYKNLIIHDEIEARDSIRIYAQSELSLNIMSWHKDGMTERIANMILNKALVISDKSRYLEEEFDMSQMCLFDLEQIEKLPAIINDLFEDKHKIKGMQTKAYNKAVKEHTWLNRAKQFLEIIEEASGENLL